ncbi:hypothetical protein B0F90DRAFT_1742782 [Multifurca ochricompacta]|uniref:Uncharacterized protein n=1 Tax=Multifurca ochricompacta TaxID=376703 RepID=A0AAD4M2B5_9AGAM|nr:hypothetical protein B0F90DRAFT_1742782 [Multifurca ochricompacta]
MATDWLQCQVKGYIDIVSLEIDADVSVNVPTFETIQLGELKRHLRDGVNLPQACV